ncbi:hypothetical protein ACZ90_11620, partial [Streptomyces albus subsp. albus]
SWSTYVLRGAPFAYINFPEPLDIQATALTSRSWGKAAFDGDASGGQDPVGLLLGGCEPAGAGGLEAGDDHGIVAVVVRAEEAQVGQGAEAGSTQVGQDAVAAGGGDVVGAAGPGGRYPYQTAPSSISARTCRPWRRCLPE